MRYTIRFLVGLWPFTLKLLGVAILCGWIPLLSQTARFAYVANGSGGGPGTISAYAVNKDTGFLTPVAGSPFPGGQFPRWVTVDPSGDFLYVANSNDNTISAYTIDNTTGALTPITGSPFPLIWQRHTRLRPKPARK
jgi:DNA-binding beta-propeller fold protein YncE